MITTKQGAKKLRISEIRLRQLLNADRIPGAEKTGDGPRGVWMLPDDPVIDPPLEVKFRRKKK